MNTEPTLTHEPTHERAVVYSEKEILAVYAGVIPFQTLILRSLLLLLHERGALSPNPSGSSKMRIMTENSIFFA